MQPVNDKTTKKPDGRFVSNLRETAKEAPLLGKLSSGGFFGALMFLVLRMAMLLGLQTWKGLATVGFVFFLPIRLSNPLPRYQGLWLYLEWQKVNEKRMVKVETLFCLAIWYRKVFAFVDHNTRPKGRSKLSVFLQFCRRLRAKRRRRTGFVALNCCCTVRPLRRLAADLHWRHGVTKAPLTRKSCQEPEGPSDAERPGSSTSMRVLVQGIVGRLSNLACFASDFFWSFVQCHVWPRYSFGLLYFFKRVFLGVWKGNHKTNVFVSVELLNSNDPTTATVRTSQKRPF